MKTTKWMASLAFGTALLGAALSVHAQYVQNAIAIPIAPGCAAGESWTKNGVRYQCESPPPSCQYGFASGPAWTGSSWRYSCNAPPVVTPPTNPESPPNNPTTELASCGAAIRSAQAGQAWAGNFLSVQFIPNMGYGWTAYSTSTAGSGNYVATDGTMTLYGDAWGAGVDGVFSGIDNLSAQELYMGECRISHASGSVLSVDFVPIAPNCSGCNSGR